MSPGLAKREAGPGAAHPFRLRWAVLLAASLALLAIDVDAAEPVRPPAKLAVIEFGMLDTSGELRDQQAEHATRLHAMMDQIRADLARSPAFSVTDLASSSSATAPPDQDQALASARAAGADYAVLGVVQKMSTLVLWCRASLVDVDTHRIVLDRWLTFRGDTDQAWRRAASFLAREIEAHPPGS